MPAMIRVKGKATKIADKILGIPANIRFSQDAAGKRGNLRLIFEETHRVR